ncbi:unnamed protein product [Anisakis simplex]|uniref:Uncharacterized protein n=1 Tax=Anisakis simplex TaxID=6269 RepID=A0A3P6NV58_ANISI|nr:unnamed protein product [Anisakis simplex]
MGESPECFLNAHSISSPEAYFQLVDHYFSSQLIMNLVSAMKTFQNIVHDYRAIVSYCSIFIQNAYIYSYEVLNRTAQMYLDDDADRMTLISNNNNISYQSTALPLLALNTTLSYQQNDVDGLNDILNAALGPIQSHLALSLAIAWILVFFGVFKGIGSIGWAVTITATLPYLLLGMLLLRGVSLPGAQQGLAFLFKPKVEKLWSIPMWKSAAEQVFYSLGIDAGPLISMASFSRYRNNIYRDAVAVVIM